MYILCHSHNWFFTYGTCVCMLKSWWDYCCAWSETVMQTVQYYHPLHLVQEFRGQIDWQWNFYKIYYRYPQFEPWISICLYEVLLWSCTFHFVRHRGIPVFTSATSEFRDFSRHIVFSFEILWYWNFCWTFRSRYLMLLMVLFFLLAIQTVQGLVPPFLPYTQLHVIYKHAHKHRWRFTPKDFVRCVFFDWQHGKWSIFVWNHMACVYKCTIRWGIGTGATNERWVYHVSFELWFYCFIVACRVSIEQRAQHRLHVQTL
jgi:hypothetical protein